MKTTTLIDFAAPESAGTWRVINDEVMGGLSTSEFLIAADSTAVFQGTVSLENNGGFASVRSLPADYAADGCAGLSIRVRGDGRRYTFRVRTDDRFDGVSYQAPFETRPGEWMEIRLPFAMFQPTFRGRPVPEAPPLDPAAARQLGFLIADRQEESFRLEIARIEAYTEPDE